jgi:crossover junction endodeoxyribonuclease RuvC
LVTKAMNTRILGIDPGSRVTGFAVLEHKDRRFEALCCDVIRLTDTEDALDRLRQLYSETAALISAYRPNFCAIETPVYGKDPSAMLKLGRAQAAVIMSALHHDIPLFEYYPKAVKKAITGTGNASKAQVAYMLHKLISMPQNTPPGDATDALAVAWCHFQKLQEPGSGREAAPSRSGAGSPSTRNRKNTWSAFVANNPERILKR